jgi:exonuclease SbcD
MTRILHTSDWHLGVSLEAASREPDHALFLDWLAGTLAARQVDVLVIAGDIFDQAVPTSESQRLYYRFLHRVAQTCVRQVVVVGGNHDSAARLEAPADLLGAFSVHVVGGMAAGEASLDRYLVPIRDAAGVVQTVILAIPYVHEYRVGVRAAFSESVDLATLLREGFTSLYTRVADRAHACYGIVPLVATGHMACMGSDRGDAPLDIHLIGTLGALPPSIFDARLQYVALGHIHRGFRVGTSRAWYSGTPVALNWKEAQTPRRVLLIDTQAELDAEPVVESVQVPEFRQIIELRGTPPAVMTQLRNLTWTTPLPPLVQLVVRVPSYQPGIGPELAKATPAGVQIVKLIQDREVDDAPIELVPSVSLSQLQPEEVFRRLCHARSEPMDDALLTAFHSLLGDFARSEGQGERP